MSVLFRIRSVARSAARSASRIRLTRIAAVVAATTTVVGLAAAGWSGGSSRYTVVAGDSLWAIATSRGITVAQLASANGIDPNAILSIGKVLTIPGAAIPTAHSLPAAAGGAAGGAARGAAGAGGAAGSGLSAHALGDCSSLPAVSSGPAGQLAVAVAASPGLSEVRQLLSEWAGYYGLSLPLFEAVTWQESGWYQGAVSSTGAVGVGQIEPGTALFISKVLVGRTMNVYSLSDNIEMSAAYLSYLSHVEGSNQCATLAAYYEGPLELQSYGLLPDARAYVSDIQALAVSFE